MRDFLLDQNGDVVIKSGDIKMTKSNSELLLQKIKTVLGTNKGEWIFDQEQGIDYRIILVKNPDREEILGTVRDGLKQVDESLEVIEYKFEMIKRHLILTFRATNGNNEEISLAVGQAITQNGKTVILCALTANEIISAGNATSVECICSSDTENIHCEI